MQVSESNYNYQQFAATLCTCTPMHALQVRTDAGHTSRHQVPGTERHHGLYTLLTCTDA